MSQIEAWIVTALGMTVVFIGLVLCIVFIQLFNWLARRITWGEHGAAAASAPTAPPMVASAPEQPTTAPVVAEPVAADVLAVIAAVLEVERKLYLSRPDVRLTIRRPATQS